MWNNILSWLFDIIKGISGFINFLFTPLSEFTKIPIQVYGINTTLNLAFWENWFPGFRIIDLISVSGLTIVFLILLFKKVDIFS